MLRCLAVLFFAVSLTAARAQDGDQLYTATRQQLDVTKVVLAQEHTWNKGDLDGFISLYKDAPETEAMLAGPVRGLSNIRSAFHLNYPNRESMGVLENTEVQVRALGENYALASGKYRIVRTRKGGGNVEGTFFEIFEKADKGWRIIFSQTS